MSRGICTKKACGGCFYAGGFGPDVCCHYLLITGHRRPCPAGEGCSVKVKGRRRQGEAFRGYHMPEVWDTEDYEKIDRENGFLETEI